MKNFILLSLVFVLFSCSGSDDSSPVNQPDSNNFFKINGTTYALTNAHIDRQTLGEDTIFTIALTNAEITNSEVIPEGLTHLASFTLHMHSSLNQLPTGTFNFQGNYGFDAYSIQDNIVVENGEITSRNVLSNQSDLVNQDGRIIITKIGENYNFNFNLLTSLGVIQGQYTGAVTKNYQ